MQSFVLLYLICVLRKINPNIDFFLFTGALLEKIVVTLPTGGKTLGFLLVIDFEYSIVNQNINI